MAYPPLKSNQHFVWALTCKPIQGYDLPEGSRSSRRRTGDFQYTADTGPTAAKSLTRSASAGLPPIEMCWSFLWGDEIEHFRFSTSSQYSLSILKANVPLTEIYSLAYCFPYIYLIFLLLFPFISVISWLDSWISQADLILQSSLFYSFCRLKQLLERSQLLYLLVLVLWEVFFLLKERGLTFSIFIRIFNQICVEISRQSSSRSRS